MLLDGIIKMVNKKTFNQTKTVIQEKLEYTGHSTSWKEPYAKKDIHDKINSGLAICDTIQSFNQEKETGKKIKDIVKESLYNRILTAGSLKCYNHGWLGGKIRLDNITFYKGEEDFLDIFKINPLEKEILKKLAIYTNTPLKEVNNHLHTNFTENRVKKYLQDIVNSSNQTEKSIPNFIDSNIEESDSGKWLKSTLKDILNKLSEKFELDSKEVFRKLDKLCKLGPKYSSSGTISYLFYTLHQYATGKESLAVNYPFCQHYSLQNIIKRTSIIKKGSKGKIPYKLVLDILHDVPEDVPKCSFRGHYYDLSEKGPIVQSLKKLKGNFIPLSKLYKEEENILEEKWNKEYEKVNKWIENLNIPKKLNDIV